MKYAGVGARDTPKEIMVLMTSIASKLSKREYLLRSGGASGADTAFANGASLKEIFVPWEKFNDNPTPYFNPTYQALELAKKYHPKWGSLSQGAKKLHGRNTQIVLGKDCDDPVDFCICWTKEGKIVGGTGQALRICKDNNIPIYNLAIDEDIDRLYKDFDL